MNCFNANKKIKKQTLKLPRKHQHKQESSQIPDLAVMSVERSTSVKSGLNLDNDFIETSTTIVEQKFPTHHKKQLESDIHVSLKVEDMKSEWGKQMKKKVDESVNVPRKCPICDKVFVKFYEYIDQVWPLQLEENSRDYINWLVDLLNEV